MFDMERSKESLVRTALVASVALGLAGIVKTVLHVAGSRSPQPQKGGWTNLEDLPADHPSYTPELARPAGSANMSPYSGTTPPEAA